MAEYIVETRIHLDVADDEAAKLQIAILLGIYRTGVEDGMLLMTDIEMGLLRDNEPVELPVELPNDNSNVHPFKKD